MPIIHKCDCCENQEEVNTPYATVEGYYYHLDEKTERWWIACSPICTKALSEMLEMQEKQTTKDKGDLN